jgi:hypothetical protein
MQDTVMYYSTHAKNLRQEQTQNKTNQLLKRRHGMASLLSCKSYTESGTHIYED